ncbi:hypothetical protein FJ872_29285 [Mesorhizobium sp. B2-5-9]|nr:hypothetical protein FJ423_32115 [Mesorhizobium sp. B2-8-9]TPJ14780.1 hypothetical protein FJ425_30400 [Mesorhizobium sp. B2-7-2]TPJ70212.1 hypothetical protein FJ419_29760 [Mesorhizobium sp. B2-6-2]TPK02300.1 hypothetical protein FJ872_29285 [Mesorhizobium sp. B2-5-9]TPK05710.1 hypothetical protein FJ543_31045 [Mesorhizobium sp. B2-5-7]
MARLPKSESAAEAAMGDLAFLPNNRLDKLLEATAVEEALLMPWRGVAGASDWVASAGMLASSVRV